MQRLNDLRIGENVEEILRLDLQTERDAVDGLREAIAHCASVSDFKTRAMLEEMVQEEEGHVDYFETQLEAIRQVGIERYLAQHLHA
jgi:bacterioferritin